MKDTASPQAPLRDRSNKPDKVRNRAITSVDRAPKDRAEKKRPIGKAAGADRMPEDRAEKERPIGKAAGADRMPEDRAEKERPTLRVDDAPIENPELLRPTDEGIEKGIARTLKEPIHDSELERPTAEAPPDWADSVDHSSDDYAELERPTIPAPPPILQAAIEKSARDEVSTKIELESDPLHKDTTIPVPLDTLEALKQMRLSGPILLKTSSLKNDVKNFIKHNIKLVLIVAGSAVATGVALWIITVATAIDTSAKPSVETSTTSGTSPQKSSSDAKEQPEQGQEEAAGSLVATSLPDGIQSNETVQQEAMKNNGKETGMAGRAQPGKDTVSITLRGIPPHARVEIDDETVTHPVLLPKSNEPVLIRVFADGYRSLVKRVVPDKNQMIDAWMKRRVKNERDGTQRRSKKGASESNGDLRPNPFKR